jgi:hypothetical protein
MKDYKDVTVNKEPLHMDRFFNSFVKSIGGRAVAIKTRPFLIIVSLFIKS